MAYPLPSPLPATTLTNQESLDSIVQSEASILQGLNQLYCEEFVADLLAIPTADPKPEDRLLIMASILDLMACKECTVANVISAVSEVLSVDKGLISTTSSSEKCSYCN